MEAIPQHHRQPRASLPRERRLIAALRSDEVAACAQFIAALPLYASYGLSAERAEAMLRRALTDPRSVLQVQHVNDQPVALAWLVRRGAFDRSAYLRLIAVAHSAIGQGHGDALLAQLEADHLHQGGLTLMVTATNHAAQRFYARRGYQQVGAIAGFAHPDHTEQIWFKAAPSD